MNNKSFGAIGALFHRVRAGLSITAVILVAGLTGMSSSVIAATPDGTTPANEGICDQLIGGTPGLYGLCVAYCEAQDLDSMAKEPPNTKILDNYRKKMKAGDPDMPCVYTPCPCWTDEQLASITSDGLAAACLRNTGSIQLINNDVPNDHFAFADTTRNRCSYENENLSPPVVDSQRITDEQAQICYDAVDAACGMLGM